MAFNGIFPDYAPGFGHCNLEKKSLLLNPSRMAQKIILKIKTVLSQVVAGRLCEEAFYEWATKNDSKSISSDPEKQAKQAASIAKTVTDAVVGLLNKEVLPQSAE